jgi:hypothetical protein
MPMLLAAMHFEKNWFSGNSRMGTREFGRETRIWGRGIAESDNGRLHQTCLPNSFPLVSTTNGRQKSLENVVLILSHSFFKVLT